MRERPIRTTLLLAALALSWPASSLSAQDERPASQEEPGPEEIVPAHEEEPPVYMGRAFLFEADLDRGVELGWLESDYPRDEVLAAIEQSLADRLKRSARFVEAVVLREDDVMATVFVGKQADTIEQMLIDGLSGPGRLSLHVVPGSEDFEACGSTLTADRARLEAWLAEQPVSSVARFNQISRAEGGPCESIRWLSRFEDDEPLGGETSSDGALPVLREPSFLFRAGAAESFELTAPSEETLAISLTLKEAEKARLEGFVDLAGGRELTFVVNGEAMRIWPTPETIADPVVLEGTFSLEQLRPILFSFAGEPLPAPLRFVEFSMRELPNVKIRDSPTAID